MSDATATTSSDQSSPSIEMKPVRSSKKSMKTKKQSGSEDQAPGASEASSQTDDNGEVSVNLAFQQLDEPEVPLFVEAKNLIYEVPTKPTKTHPENKKRLLHNVNAYFTPGELVAIMGPTGAGKSTFLNVIARRNKIGVSGDLHYNGRPANRDLKRQIAYVLQDDILFPHLTVQETLSYTAQLRQPGDMSYEDKMLKVDEVISALNLNKARHTIIGDSTQRGVSGGERKRVNIGVQLLSDPSAIFLDEPTSGLDTSTAFSLVKTLRSIAKSGYTVAATIHQPASHIFDLFDKVVLLLDGNVIYFGPQKQMRTYLKTMLGIDVPLEHNAADYLMGNVLDEEQRNRHHGRIGIGELKQKCIETWKKHGPHPYDAKLAELAESKALKKLEKRQINHEHAVQKAADQQDASKRPKFPIGWGEQVKVLSHRAIRRAATQYIQPVPLIQQLIVALIVGAVWWQTPTDESGYRDIMGAGFFIAIYAGGFTPILEAIFNFPTERVVISRERSEGSYRMSAYFFAKIISEIPLQILSPTGFVIVSYWMVGLRKEAGPFFLFLVLLLAANLASSGAGLIIGSIVTKLRVASMSATVVMLLFMLLAGFYRPVVNLPVWFGWLHYLSFVKYLYDGVIQTLFSGVWFAGAVGGVSGDDIITSVTPVIPAPGWNVLALFGWAVVYRILAFICLKISFKVASK